MVKASATLLLGITVGLVGAMIYMRLKEVEEEQNAEILLGKICNHLLDLELARVTAEA